MFKTNLFGKKIIRIYGSDNVRKVIQGENKLVQSSYPTSVQTLFGDQTISMSHGEAHKEKKTRLMKYLVCKLIQIKKKIIYPRKLMTLTF